MMANQIVLRRTAHGVCLLLPLLAAPAWGLAAEWPQWGGRNDRNMVSPEKGLPDDFALGSKRSDGSGIDMATTRHVRWVVRLGSQTYGTPTVAGGRVYVGTNDFALDDPKYTPTKGGLLKCLDEATGKLLWQLVIPRLESHEKTFNFDNMDLGLCCSPTVDGDRVYVVTNRCEVLCLDVHGMANGNDGPFLDEGQYCVGPGKPPVTPGSTDADILWQFDMLHDLPVQPHDAACCSVLVLGDMVYVCTSNGVEKGGARVPLPLAPSLIVLEKKTGRLVAADEEQIGTRLFHGQWSSPAVAEVNGRSLILFGAGDGVCYAFEPVREVPLRPVPLHKVWWCDCNPPQYKVHDGKPIGYWTGDIRRHLGNNGDGTFASPSEIIATPVFHDNRVYVAVGQDPRHGRGRGVLTCIDATGSGEVTERGKLWTYDGVERTLSTVAIAGGLLYLPDLAGQIHCLDAQTGQCLWVHRTGAEAWGSTLVVDGRVYLGTAKSLWVLASGRELKMLHEYRPGAPLWCSPVAANGTLYLASQRYLWAIAP